MEFGLFSLGLHVGGHRRFDAAIEGNGWEKQEAGGAEGNRQKLEEDAAQTVQWLADEEVIDDRCLRKKDGNATLFEEMKMFLLWRQCYTTY